MSEQKEYVSDLRPSFHHRSLSATMSVSRKDVASTAIFQCAFGASIVPPPARLRCRWISQLADEHEALTFPRRMSAMAYKLSRTAHRCLRPRLIGAHTITLQLSVSPQPLWSESVLVEFVICSVVYLTTPRCRYRRLCRCLGVLSRGVVVVN